MNFSLPGSNASFGPTHSVAFSGHPDGFGVFQERHDAVADDGVVAIFE